MSRLKLTILLLLLIASTIAIPNYMVSQGQQSSSKFKPQDTSDKALRATFPSVDYANYRASPEEAIKGEKYRSSMSVLTSDASEDVVSVTRLEWDLIPALPSEKSDAIVLGTVKRVTAHLPARKHTVYTEVDIEIESVFKHDGRGKVHIGKIISAEREGGVVRYPSGFQIWHRVGQQRMPVAGKKYYFFLSYEFPAIGKSNDLYILTAYEVNGGVIAPLDTVDKFATFTGKSEFEFHTDLVSSLGQ